MSETTPARRRGNLVGFLAIVLPPIVILTGMITGAYVVAALGTVLGVTLGGFGVYRKGESKVSSIIALVLWTPCMLLALISILIWAANNQ
ncbi:hypothetical protein ACFRFH_12210 [Leifsonia sp. NPDC056824]|uniref:hypothetical protein n=1 Tax=Leifsonia sp. NPDC056824 TaxID=3345953 RepID=UPI0036A8249B